MGCLLHRSHICPVLVERWIGLRIGVWAAFLEVSDIEGFIHYRAWRNDLHSKIKGSRHFGWEKGI